MNSSYNDGSGYVIALVLLVILFELKEVVVALWGIAARL